MTYKVYFEAIDKGYVKVTADNEAQAYERAKDKFANFPQFVEYIRSTWKVTEYEEVNDEE